MILNELHKSHIGRVAVDFCLSGRALDPSDVSQVLNISPDSAARIGDERRNSKGDILPPHDEGYWLLSTKGKVDSKDVNDHINYLLDLLLPRSEQLTSFVQHGEVDFGVLWESSYLYAGTGPMLSRECLEGMSRLGASLSFDIYQIDADEAEE